MSQDRSFIWKSDWKALGWACNLGGAVSQGINRIGQTVISRLMESQIWCLSTGRGLRKGTMACACTSIWEKATTPALVLMPDTSDTSVPPVCPWCLSSCFLTVGVYSKLDQVSLCMGPLSGNLELQKPSVPFSHNLCWDLTARSYRDFSSWH